MRAAVRRALCIAAAPALFAASDVAAHSPSVALGAAQQDTPDLFARSRGVAVRERPQPAYDAIGLKARGFTLWPDLRVQTTHDDNVFAAERAPQAAVVVRLTPQIAARSDWGRHGLEGHARLDIDRNLDFDSENVVDARLGASGRLDVNRGAWITAGADYAHAHDPRTAAGVDATTARPVAYDLASARLEAVRTAGRLRLSARAEAARTDYRDGVNAAGGAVEQDDRDRTVLRLGGRADYAVSPGLAVFVQMAGDERDHRRIAGRPSRTSSGGQILAGVDFERGGLMRGEIAAGYLRQGYRDAAFGDIDGFSGRARVSWFVTPLTTIVVTASRSVQDAAVVGASGALRTEAAVAADHELLRNLILSARLTRTRDVYEGLSRIDERSGLGVGADYRMNRRYGVVADLTWLDQSSSGAAAGPNYRSTRISIAAVGRF